MEEYDVIIIGAGISGLSLAHYCSKKKLRTLVIEKNGRTGGCFHSQGFEGDASDFWIELGAHTCYNSYGNLIGIMEDCGIIDRIIRREKVSFKILVDGNIKSIPSQLNFPELLLSAPRLFLLKKSGRSIESYYGKIVGRRNFERVFAPAFDAVISQRANDFPAEMLFKKRPRRKDILKTFTLRGGVQTIIEAISSRGEITIVKDREAREVAFGGGLFEVSTGNGAGYKSRTLAVATPAPAAAKILGLSFPELSGNLSRIKVERVETMGVTVKKNALSLGPLAGIIAVNDSFYSAVSRDTVPHEAYRGFTFHFRAGIADRDSKLKRIGEVLGIDTRRIDHVVTKDNFVPALRVGHEALIGDLDRGLAGKRLLLTGNYFSGMAIEDCVSRSLSEFRRLEEMLA